MTQFGPIEDAPINFSWIAAIYSKHSSTSRPLGAAIIVDDQMALTCSHVVKSMKDADVLVVCPDTETGLPLRFAVSQIQPLENPEGLAYAPSTDVSILWLAERVPDSVQLPPIRCPDAAAVQDLHWWSYGFPNADPQGNSASGRIGAALMGGWIRLDYESRYGFEKGFSGSGVWCSEYQALIGIVGQANSRGDGRALMFRRLQEILPYESPFNVRSRWWFGDAGATALSEWGMRPVGGLSYFTRKTAVEPMSLSFYGRRKALSHIIEWLAKDGSGVCVVTGEPGSGKSAVIGRVVITADDFWHDKAPLQAADVVANRNAVTCAFHARDKSALEIAYEVGRALSAELPSGLGLLAPAVLNSCGRLQLNRIVVVLDALDEQDTSQEAMLLIRYLILPLLEPTCGVGAKFLIGCRRSTAEALRRVLGQSLQVVDLDDTEYFAEDDLVAYTEAALRVPTVVRPPLPSSSAGPVAAKIARSAGTNFLIAGLQARDYSGGNAYSPDASNVGPLLDDALFEYMARLGGVGHLTAVQALTALAFADLPGFGADDWAVVVGSLFGEGLVNVRQLEQFARTAASNYVTEERRGRNSAFRLYHLALNEALLARRSRDGHDRRRDEASIVQSLLESGRALGWNLSTDYALRSLPRHAELGGAVDDLLADDDYLVRADLLRLLPVVNGASTEFGWRRARLLRLTPGLIGTDVSERAALLSITNAVNTLRAGLPHYADQPYVCLWAETRPHTETATVGRHSKEWVSALTIVGLAGRRAIASGGDDNLVKVWDPHNGQELRILKGHVGGVLGVASVGVDAAASLDGDGTLRIWNLLSGELEIAIGAHPAGGQCVCAVDTPIEIAVLSGGSDGLVKLWSRTGALVNEFLAHAGSVLSLSAFVGDDGLRVISAGEDGYVRVSDGQGTKLFESAVHTGPVLAVAHAYLEGRVVIASAAEDGVIHLWWPDSGESRGYLAGHDGAVLSLCWIERERPSLVSGGADGVLCLWRVPEGAVELSFDGVAGPVLSIAVLDEDEAPLLVSAGSDSTVRLWSSNPADVIPSPPVWVPVKSVCEVEVRGVRKLASGGNAGSVLWDPDCGDQLAASHVGVEPVNAVCALQVGGRGLLASGSADHTVRVWDPESGEAELAHQAHDGPVNSLCALQVGGRWHLASGSADHTVRVWDPESGEAELAHQAHDGPVNSLCALQVGGRWHLASGGYDGAVRLWGPEARNAGLAYHSPDPVNSLCALQVGGRWLLASGGADHTVRVWDPESGEAELAHQAHDGPVNAVCALQIGRRWVIASGSADRAVCLWDVATRTLERTIPIGYVVTALGSAANHLAVGLTEGLLSLDMLPGGTYR